MVEPAVHDLFEPSLAVAEFHVVGGGTLSSCSLVRSVSTLRAERPTDQWVTQGLEVDVSSFVVVLVLALAVAMEEPCDPAVPAVAGAL